MRLGWQTNPQPVREVTYGLGGTLPHEVLFKRHFGRPAKAGARSCYPLQGALKSVIDEARSSAEPAAPMRDFLSHEVMQRKGIWALALLSSVTFPK
jgi:hypothetical protein